MAEVEKSIPLIATLQISELFMISLLILIIFFFFKKEENYKYLIRFPIHFLRI